MSSGPPAANENPRSGVSNWKLLTPRSSSTPSTGRKLSAAAHCSRSAKGVLAKSSRPACTASASRSPTRRIAAGSASNPRYPAIRSATLQHGGGVATPAERSVDEPGAGRDLQTVEHGFQQNRHVLCMVRVGWKQRCVCVHHLQWLRCGELAFTSSAGWALGAIAGQRPYRLNVLKKSLLRSAAESSPSTRSSQRLGAHSSKNLFWPAMTTSASIFAYVRNR
jgi:hypothetical protein